MAITICTVHTASETLQSARFIRFRPIPVCPSAVLKFSRATPCLETQRERKVVHTKWTSISTREGTGGQERGHLLADLHRRREGLRVVPEDVLKVDVKQTAVGRHHQVVEMPVPGQCEGSQIYFGKLEAAVAVAERFHGCIYSWMWASDFSGCI